MPQLRFKLTLSPKYILFGLFIGAGLLIGILKFIPDGKLHIVFCDVGQGDAIYIRMPNMADMLVDGGPNESVLGCLGKFMPFYDRTIDVVVLTHPQKDHLQGLIRVLDRYDVRYFITVPVGNTSEGYRQLRAKLEQLLSSGKISVKYLLTGEEIKFREVRLTSIWPQKSWLIKSLSAGGTINSDQIDVDNLILSYKSSEDLNRYSLYLHLVYGNFDLLLTGDGDSKTQTTLRELHLDLLVPQLEVLKVPHHGSRTGMTDEFLNITRPSLSVIQVGKNSYGHPSPYTLSQLKRWGKVLTTQNSGDIEVITDGITWKVNP